MADSIPTPMLVLGGGAVLLVAFLAMRGGSGGAASSPVTLAPPPDPGVAEAQINATGAEIAALTGSSTQIVLGQQAQTTALETSAMNNQLENARIGATLSALQNTNATQLDIAKGQQRTATNQSLFSAIGSGLASIAKIFANL